MFPREKIQKKKRKKKRNGKDGNGIKSVQLIERDMDRFYGIS